MSPNPSNCTFINNFTNFVFFFLILQKHFIRFNFCCVFVLTNSIYSAFICIDFYLELWEHCDCNIHLHISNFSLLVLVFFRKCSVCFVCLVMVRANTHNDNYDDDVWLVWCDTNQGFAIWWNDMAAILNGLIWTMFLVQRLGHRYWKIKVSCSLAPFPLKLQLPQMEPPTDGKYVYMNYIFSNFHSTESEFMKWFVLNYNYLKRFLFFLVGQFMINRCNDWCVVSVEYQKQRLWFR